MGVINIVKNNFTSSEDILIDSLKKATIKNSHSRKFKKVLFLTIGIALVFVALAIGILIYEINKPFNLIINTNVSESSNYELKIKKGSLISDLEAIELEGYNFVGWYKDENFTQKYADTEIVDKKTPLFAS